MFLHQLLRFIETQIPIVLFDLKDRTLQSVMSKEDINIDLYEERVYVIGTGDSNFHNNRHAIYITLEK